jgi:hypothetical protein
MLIKWAGRLSTCLRVLVASMLLATDTAHAQNFLSKFRDSLDGRFDASDWLLKQKGFLPVPIIITEPALGYGGGLAVAFFRNSIGEGKRDGRFVPPTIFGGAGFYTAGGSYGAGLGVFHPFREDRFRYRGAVAAASLDLKFYGFNPNGVLAEDPLAYTIGGLFMYQKFQARVRESPFLVGAAYTFFSSKTRFDTSVPDEISPGDLKVKIGGLGAGLEYDTRDNLLDARRGIDLAASATWYDKAFGSDEAFATAKVKGLFYAQPLTKWEIGLRLDGQYAWSDPPFFVKPYLSMRGLAALQYANNLAVLGESELRYAIDNRWTVLGFGGAGWVADTWSHLGDDSAVGAGGLGFRYLLVRQLGLRSGVDFAVGPGGEFAFYIQTGAAWR